MLYSSIKVFISGILLKFLCSENLIKFFKNFGLTTLFLLLISLILLSFKNSSFFSFHSIKANLFSTTSYKSVVNLNESSVFLKSCNNSLVLLIELSFKIFLIFSSSSNNNL
jgi:hypothetical protein